MITNSISPKQLKVREYCTPSTTPRPYIRSYFKSPLHLMPIICTQQEDTLSYDKEICVMYLGETLEKTCWATSHCTALDKHMSLLAIFFSFSAVTIRSSIVHLRMCFALANIEAVAWYMTLVCCANWRWKMLDLKNLWLTFKEEGFAIFNWYYFNWMLWSWGEEGDLEVTAMG